MFVAGAITAIVVMSFLLLLLIAIILIIVIHTFRRRYVQSINQFIHVNETV